MSYNKGIWKTGVLAITVTLVFAVFVFKSGDWMNGLNSEFVVYGTTAGTGGGGGSTGGSGGGTSVTKVIPQVAVGSFDGGLTKYITVISILNTGTTATSISGNFYNQDGTASTVAMKSSLITAGFTGTLPSTNLNANAVMTITADTAPTGKVNWARIVSTGSVSVSAYFELRDGVVNVLYNRVGIAASPATMQKFIIPRVRNVASGLDVGFAIANTTSTAANVTITAKDNTGATLAAKTLTLAANSQTATFPFQFFSLTTEASGTNYGYLQFDGASAAFAATALAVEGGSLSSFPIEVLQ